MANKNTQQAQRRHRKAQKALSVDDQRKEFASKRRSPWKGAKHKPETHTQYAY